MIGILNSVPSTIPGFPAGPPSYNPGGSITTTPYLNGGSVVTQNQTSVFGLASIAGILVSVLVIVILLTLVGLLVIIVVANRADPDPSGRRPQSVYFFAVSFITLTTSIIGSAVVVSAPISLIGHHSGSLTNSIARTAVAGGLVTLVSVLLLVTHLQRGVALARADDQMAAPTRRVGQSYVSAVSFLAVLVLLVVTILSMYLIFAIAGPGVFGAFGGRSPAVRVLIESVYLGVVASVVLWTHANLVPPGLRIFKRIARPGGPGAVASASAPAPPAQPS